MINPKLPAILYGGDYNPDQWPEEIWREDMRLFRLGINVVVVPVFSWSCCSLRKTVMTSSGWIGFLILAENGIYACIATSTAAQPAWMSVKYPEILPVDVHGRKRTHGKRVNFCPNSKVYRSLRRASPASWPRGIRTTRLYCTGGWPMSTAPTATATPAPKSSANGCKSVMDYRGSQPQVEFEFLGHTIHS